MTEEKKEYINYAFYWGSIIGFFTFLWYIIGFYTSLEKQWFFGDLYFFCQILMIMAMIIKYKKLHKEQTIKFSRIITIGFIAALIVAGFYTIYFILRIVKLDSLFFELFINEIFTALKTTSGIDYASKISSENIGLMKTVFIIATYLSSLLNSMIYTLLAYGFVYLNEKIYARK